MMMIPAADRLRSDGAVHCPAVVPPDDLAALLAAADDALSAGPGRRLEAGGGFASWLMQPGAVWVLAADLIGPDARPVRAVVFDKTPEANWTVAWHQDRTIVVEDRHEAEGFGPWSVKAGLQHVAPPFAVLERMVTLRIHLDPCGPDNAPLKAALGTHRLGIVPAIDAAAVALAHTLIECHAEPGDVWAYATPILHASERAAVPGRRRVLQVDYAAFDLPAPLQWRGLA